jgi:hypothetical protein
MRYTMLLGLHPPWVPAAHRPASLSIFWDGAQYAYLRVGRWCRGLNSSRIVLIHMEPNY